MNYRPLGTTGIKVSSLCMGTMTFGANDWGVGSLGQTEANEMVAACIDHGINFFDTANVYSAGDSENVLGRAIQGKRDRLIIATKVRGRMGEDVNEIGTSRRHIMSQVEQSLKRLGIDYIDLYQVHCWDELTPLEETLSTLNTLVTQGKVRYIGCSNYTAWQVERAMAISEKRGYARFETVQPWYSLVGRDIEAELVPVCRDHGLGILPWSPLGGSFLTGKYRRGAARPEGSRRFDSAKAFLPIDEEKGFDIVEVLVEIGKARDASPAQVALNWLRAKPQVTSVIVGARTMDQLRDNLKASTWDLTPDEVTRLDDVSAVKLPYPVWFINQANK